MEVPHLIRKIMLFAVILGLAACKDDEPVDPFQAERLVELITTNPNWQEEYPDANIVTETKFVDEYQGERTLITLYPKTTDELTVVYQGDKPQELYWNKSGQWNTAVAKVGDPITALEQANKAPISFHGLGYDLPGKVKIETGELANSPYIYVVRPTSDVIPSEFYSYDSFDLSDPGSKELNLYITRIQVPLNSVATEVAE